MRMLLFRTLFLFSAWCFAVANAGAQTSGASVAIPGSAAGQPSSGATAPYLTIKDYDKIKSLVGQTVLVRGEADEFKPAWNDRAPNVVYLREGDKEMEIVYWVGPASTVKPPDLTKKGTPVFARGKVEIYRGRLQVNLDDNVVNLSTTPLAAEIASGANEAAMAAASGRTPRPAASPIVWEAYSPLAAQSDIAAGRSVLVYARSKSVPLCETVEKAYMLHPELATILGPRTIYFIELSQQSDVVLAQQLQVTRVPTLVVMVGGQENKQLTFTTETKPDDVRAFLAAIPKITR